MSSTMIYIGSYSSGSGEGITMFTLDSNTGRLSPAFEPVKITNPSYLAFSREESILYTVMETDRFDGRHGGGVAAFSVDTAGRLTMINAQPTYGRCPCYLSADRRGQVLLAANYWEGTCSAFPLTQGGQILPNSAIVRHTGCGPVKERQETPHVHFADYTPDGKYAYTVDLGTDSVDFYTYDDAVLTQEPSLTIRLRPGSGPRHMIFAPKAPYAYIVNEISSEVTVVKYKENYQSEIIQYVSTLPEDFDTENTAAAVLLSADGRFLYASNRGHDSVAVYAVGHDGCLSRIGFCPSGGNGPRDIRLTPDGSWLLAANEKSNNVAVLRLNQQTGMPEPTGISAAVHSPVCIRCKKL